MRIAAVVADDGETIVTLPEGPIILIFDSKKGNIEKYENLAVNLVTERRLAVTNFLLKKQIHAVCTVPETFCTTSCQVAAQGGIKFIRLEPGAKFSTIVNNWQKYAEEVVNNLTSEEMFQKKEQK